MHPRLRWGVAPTVETDPEAGPWDGCEHATGWPLSAGWYELTTTAGLMGPFNSQGGIPLPLSLSGSTPPNPNLSRVRALPLRPIWTGLGINTAFYGVMWFGLVSSIRMARRWRRRRRGLCTRCAYDRTGLTPAQPCPECGLMPPMPKASPTTA